MQKLSRMLLKYITIAPNNCLSALSIPLVEKAMEIKGNLEINCCATTAYITLHKDLH